MELEISELKVGDIVLFRLAHWAETNWHNVELKYIGAKYIVVYDMKNGYEYGVNYVEIPNGNRPLFKI